ncbi:uncharacterized protein LOC142802744 [Rhipicephalus microplus]|uniref:uncharacterized protein LOC142802744 n=1 Tax=Rhipicephalus microplus TaxID=6941 RepID=UPI003F6D5F95
MFIILAAEMFIMYALAMVCDAKRRPYIWLSRGFTCFLGAAHVGFIVTWTVAAARDNVMWMTVGITGVAVRMVGKLVYSTIDVIVSMTTKPTISEIIALLTLHLEELPAVLFSPMYPSVTLLLTELCFLMCMNTYTTICKRAAEGSSDDDGDNGNAPTNAPTNAASSAPTNAASKATSKATSSTPARSGSISKMDSS